MSWNPHEQVYNPTPRANPAPIPKLDGPYITKPLIAATTVIIVHGVHQHKGFYDKLVKVLEANGCNAIAIDLPGFGTNNGCINGAVRGFDIQCSTSNVESFDAYHGPINTTCACSSSRSRDPLPT